MSVDLTLVEPWSADTPDLLTGTISHVATATLVMPDGEEVPLDLTAGTVGWDETRAPRVTATLTCKVPGDQAMLDRIDPRTGARLVITAGYRRPDQLLDVQPLADLGLRGRRVSRPSDTMTLTATSDEALVIDNAPSNGGSVSSLTTKAAMVEVIRLIFPGVTVSTTGAPSGPAVTQDPLGDKWTTLADLADRIDTQVYDNGLRAWFIRPTPTTTADPAVELAVGAAGTLIESDTGLDRDAGWFNRVFLTYEWTDSSNAPHTVVAVRSITSGPYTAVTGNIRTMDERREIPATSTEATAAATSLVTRTVTRGRSFTLRSVSAYWLRPGMTARVSLPLGDPELHLVAAVEFDLAAGTMRVTTRLPDGTYTIGA